MRLRSAWRRRQQHAVSELAHEKYMPSGTFVWWTILGIVVPSLVLFAVALPLSLRMLGLTGQTTAMTIGVIVVILLVWVLSAWVYGIMYTKPARRAMRERGMDVCIGCGYLLAELTGKIERCPECGATREPLVRGAADGDGS